MLQQIRIKNFKSLKDVTVDLQNVNLFIGANNSGKTNFFKVLEFFGKSLAYTPTGPTLLPLQKGLQQLTFQQKGTDTYNSPVTFSFRFYNDSDQSYYLYQLELYLPKNINDKDDIICSIIAARSRHEFKPDLSINNDLEYVFEAAAHCSFFTSGNNFYKAHLQLGTPLFEKAKFLRFPTDWSIETEISPISDDKLLIANDRQLYNITDIISVLPYLGNSLKEVFQDLRIYRIDPAKFSGVFPLLKNQKNNIVLGDTSNLVAFIYNLKTNHRSISKQLDQAIHNLVQEFSGIELPPAPVSNRKGDALEVQIKFLDVNNLDTGYWADEVSEGVLYFLALLCIVYQPNPPKLLLLEEPERGVHPRRIREVIDLIYKLTEEKGIQVIMTTHSPYLVDQFADATDAVFVFDKEQGETTIKNLERDIIEPSDRKSDETGFPRIEYTRSLGDHWSMGFLGGVPE